jgi:hypothetical protein
VQAMVKKLQDLLNGFIGWFEIISTQGNDYKYTILDIEIKKEEGKEVVYIIYKIAGSRFPRRDTAVSLNTSHIFSLFKYSSYIEKCATKIKMGIYR